MKLKTLNLMPIRHARRRRAGKVLVAFAILLPVLLGWVGLIVETGLLMTTQGQVCGIADSAARIVAHERLRGKSDSVATLAAQDFIRQHGPSRLAARLEVWTPPVSGEHAGDGDYVEVQVTGQVATAFLPFLGQPATQPVQGRAVAGAERISLGARIITLDPDARPGLRLFGSGTVRIQGGVMVNSAGGGLDQRGETVNGQSQTAASVGNNARLYADDVQVVGGVNEPGNFLPLKPTGPPPLRVGSRPQPDPYAALPVPMVSNGADPTDRGSAKISSGNSQVSNGNLVLASDEVVLKPGVYDSIEISGGKVTFEPGVYVLRGGKQDALSITGGEVDGSAGVLFYNSGHDFDVRSGWPDRDDGNGPASNPSGSKFGGIKINMAARLAPLDDRGSPFHGLLIYQRRANSQTIQFTGQGETGAHSGVSYAKWAHLMIAGQGAYNGQCVVASLSKTGNGDMLIDTSAAAPATARKVFLVE